MTLEQRLEEYLVATKAIKSPEDYKELDAKYNGFYNEIRNLKVEDAKWEIEDYKVHLHSILNECDENLAPERKGDK